MKKVKKAKLSGRAVVEYDDNETANFIDSSKPLKFKDLGLKLPQTPPTQVVSIRLPSGLLNELRSMGSKRDIPYQALIKLILSEGLEAYKDRKSE